MSTAADDLIRILTERSVKRGDFILASGKRSTIYVDARLTTMSPEGMVIIGRLGIQRIVDAGWDPDSVGGLTLGADPIAYAISHESASNPRPIRAFTVRKEAKQHGTGKHIEGPFLPGDRVVIVEDVITSGQSALQAAEKVAAAGGQVVGVLAIVDREEGGRDAIRAAGHDVIALIRLSELVRASDTSQATPGSP